MMDSSDEEKEEDDDDREDIMLRVSHSASGLMSSCMGVSMGVERGVVSVVSLGFVVVGKAVGAVFFEVGMSIGAVVFVDGMVVVVLVVVVWLDIGLRMMGVGWYLMVGVMGLVVLGLSGR